MAIKKRKKCILHIGMHKTGTSAIQKTLFSLQSNSKFQYAKLGTENHSEIFYSLFSDKPYQYHGHLASGRKEKNIDLFNKNAAFLILSSFIGANVDSIEVVSGEDIGYLKENEVKKLKFFLDEFFEETLVIAYIRPFRSYINSAFQELVKHRLSNFDLTYCDPSYDRFSYISSIFGKKNIIFRFFKEKKLYKNNVVSDFLKTSDLHKYIGIENIEQSKINESLSLDALKILYIYNKFSKDMDFTQYSHGRDILLKKLNFLRGEKLSLDFSILNQMKEKNIRSMNFLEGILEESLDQFELEKDNSNVFCEQDLLKTCAISIEGLKYHFLKVEKMERKDKKTIIDFFAFLESGCYK